MKEDKVTEILIFAFLICFVLLIFSCSSPLTKEEKAKIDALTQKLNLLYKSISTGHITADQYAKAIKLIAETEKQIQEIKNRHKGANFWDILTYIGYFIGALGAGAVSGSMATKRHLRKVNGKA